MIQLQNVFWSKIHMSKFGMVIATWLSSKQINSPECAAILQRNVNMGD